MCVARTLCLFTHSYLSSIPQCPFYCITNIIHPILSLLGRTFISAETSSVDLSKEGSLASKDGESDEGEKKDDAKTAVQVKI